MSPDNDCLCERKISRGRVTFWAVNLRDGLLEKQHSSASEASHTLVTAQRGTSESCAGRLLAEQPLPAKEPTCPVHVLLEERAKHPAPGIERCKREPWQHTWVLVS